MPRKPMARVPVVFNLFGGISVSRAGRDVLRSFKRRKTLALLAYLASTPERMHTRAKLASLLWGDHGEAEARHALRQSVLELRTALASIGVNGLRVEGERLGLAPTAVTSDVAAFEKLASETTPAALEDAAALYRGDFLDGFGLDERGFEEWLGAERERLRHLAIDVLRRLLQRRLDGGASDGALKTATRLLALDPLDESVHRALMRVHAEAGRRGAALRQYEACAAILRRELDTEPDAETRALYRTLLPPPAAAAPSAAGHNGAPPPRAVPATALAHIETPLVARGRELATLRGQWDDVRRRACRTVVVHGEAGIGKTRLIAELARHIPRGRMLYGRCREGDGVLPLAVWIEALRPGLSPEALERVPPHWRRELGRLFPEVAAAPAVAGGGDDDLRLFQAVARTLEAVAARRACCIVLEDMHWADEMSLRLFAWIAGRLDRVPVLLLATVRTEELADAPAMRTVLGALSREERCATLTVPPLSREETAELIGRLLAPVRDVPDAAGVIDRVWRLSEGNPFVVMEAVRSNGAPDDDACRSLPERVRTLTARRLDVLPARARRLVDAAAVIGRDFELAALHRVSGLDEATLAEDVDELVRRHVLREAGERLDFTHDRVRAVAYESITGSRRRFLHRQVADALAEIHAADRAPHAAAIGRHLLIAGEWERAARLLRQAGEVASSRGAWVDARACFEEALSALERLSLERRGPLPPIDLRLAAASMAVQAVEFERASAHLLEAERLAERAGDAERLAWACCLASFSHRMAADFERSLAAASRAHTMAAAIDDRMLRREAEIQRGITLTMRGLWRAGGACLSQCVDPVAVDRPSPHPPTPGFMVRYWLVISHAELGNFGEGLAVAQALQKDVDPPHSPYAVVAAHFALGYVHLRRLDFAGAAAEFECAREAHPPTHRGVWYASTTSYLGVAYTALGRAAEAVELLETARRQTDDLGMRFQRPYRLNSLAAAYALAGRAGDAQPLAVEGLELARAQGARGAEANALFVLGMIAARRTPRNVDEAADYYRRAIACALDLEMRPLAASAYLFLARLCREVGRPEGEHHLAAARALGREMGEHFLLEDRLRRLGASPPPLASLSGSGG